MAPEPEPTPAALPQLRAMTRADLRPVVQLDSKLFGSAAWPYDVLDAELAMPDRYYVVALAKSVGPVGVDSVRKIIGYAGIAIGDVGEVMTIGVHPSAQGRGVGRALMSDLIAASTQRDVAEIFLEVRVDNEPAIKLYRSLGFIDVRVRPGYYQPENIDALVMRRKGGVP